MRVTGRDFFVPPFFVPSVVKEVEGELTRPPTLTHVSTHQNEVRSIVRGYFQNRFKVSEYKQVGRPIHDSQKQEETLEKVSIRLIRMRQGVSSDSDEQVGSSSQSTVTQTNVDKDEISSLSTLG